MGKYHGIGGFRIGKVGNERYYLRKSSNVVAIAKPYKAINSQWIKQEEFKAYIPFITECRCTPSLCFRRPPRSLIPLCPLVHPE